MNIRVFCFVLFTCLFANQTFGYTLNCLFFVTTLFKLHTHTHSLFLFLSVSVSKLVHSFVLNALEKELLVLFFSVKISFEGKTSSSNVFLYTSLCNSFPHSKNFVFLTSSLHQKFDSLQSREVEILKLIEHPNCIKCTHFVSSCLVYVFLYFHFVCMFLHFVDLVK
jgi:hypothetical protein